MRLILFCGSGNACRCRRYRDQLRRDRRDLRGCDISLRVLKIGGKGRGHTRSIFGDE
jgi:hypothetical protein